MDVTALYPSITAEMDTKAVQKSIRTSNLKWTNIDIKHLGRYMTHNQLDVTFDRQNHGFSKYAIFNTLN